MMSMTCIIGKIKSLIGLIAVCVLFCILSCYITQPIETNEFELGQPFTLQFGKQKYSEEGNITVGFSELVSEGRCPIGVMCVWEGRADIKVWLRLSRRAMPDTVLLYIYGYTSAKDTLRHQFEDIQDYRIVLMQLDPYPRHHIRIRPESYVALLRIDWVTE
jgi:hypothetical protein